MCIGLLNTIMVFLGVFLGGPGANRQGSRSYQPSTLAGRPRYVKGSARARANETGNVNGKPKS